MPNDNKKEDRDLSEELGVMHHREITLADGRYMIFYTFGEMDEKSAEGNSGDNDV